MKTILKMFPILLVTTFAHAEVKVGDKAHLRTTSTFGTTTFVVDTHYEVTKVDPTKDTFSYKEVKISNGSIQSQSAGEWPIRSGLPTDENYDDCEAYYNHGKFETITVIAGTIPVCHTSYKGTNESQMDLTDIYIGKTPFNWVKRTMVSIKHSILIQEELIDFQKN